MSSEQGSPSKRRGAGARPTPPSVRDGEGGAVAKGAATDRPSITGQVQVGKWNAACREQVTSTVVLNSVVFAGYNFQRF